MAEAKTKIEKELTPLITQKNVDFLGYLHSRWQDEREYEDFADYSKQMQKMVSPIKTLAFIKASKRPFGFTFRIISLNQHIRINVTNKDISWRTSPD